MNQPLPEHDKVIDLKGVSKRFILRKQKPFLVRQVMRRLVGREDHAEDFWALRDIDLSLERGSSLGVIGRNGAGKSTFMGLVAGTIYPTDGEVTVAGRVGALLELGAGFHEDLTGRENVYLNASLLGLNRDEVEERFDSVLAFSELEEFIDVPLRNYSSGMHMRLGFSVAVHVDPEILIMDEVMSVGDESFQEKCLAKVNEFHEAGKTLLVVSHNMKHVERLCDKVIWLEHGAPKAFGPAEKVIEEYLSQGR